MGGASLPLLNPLSLLWERVRVRGSDLRHHAMYRKQIKRDRGLWCAEFCYLMGGGAINPHFVCV